MKTIESTAPNSPAKQIAGFIARFDPAIAKLTRSCRSVLRKRYPAAIELVYDNYNALAIACNHQSTCPYTRAVTCHRTQ